MTLELTSTAIVEEEMISSQYTCDGDDVSPPLAWVGVPDQTERLALVLEDIDSVKGVWSHWVVYDMPPEVKELSEGVSPTFPRPGGGLEGRNDFGNIGYGGPCHPMVRPIATWSVCTPSIGDWASRRAPHARRFWRESRGTSLRKPS